MTTVRHYQRRSSAADELIQRYPNCNASQIVDSLSIGVTHLRDLFVRRLHDDVERFFGVDSMIAPISEDNEHKRTKSAKIEIEIYSAIVVNDEASRGNYLDSLDDWFLDWLFRLRLGERHEKITKSRTTLYRCPTAEERRLQFVSLLQQQIPETAKTPLVLFRLFPRAVRIVAAVSFGDFARAQELREEQHRFLPAVCDCHECHGRVLENEDTCRVCGNPVWTFKWLLAD